MLDTRRALSPSSSSSFGNILANNLSSFPVFAKIMGNPQVKTYSAKLRPFGEFVNKQQFSRPASVEEVTTRLEQNIKYFYMNYLIVFVLLSVYTILTQPSLLILVICSAFAWVWAQAKSEIRVGAYAFTGRNKTILIASISVLLIFLIAGSSILVLVGLCAILTAGHAIAHDIMLDPEMELEMGKKMTGTVEQEHASE